MEEILLTQKTLAFANKNLQKATNDIMKLGNEILKCALATAVIIAKVDGLECYKEDGFNSVHEWTEKTFGFKKTASYSLLKIGKEYVREVVNPKNGKIIGYASNLLPLDSDRDFTTTQIEKMLPGGHDLALELVQNGEITPEMTCKDIAKIIKNHIEPEEDTENVEVEEETEVVEEPYEDTEKEVLFTIRAIEYLDGRRVFEIDNVEYGLDKVIDITKFFNDFCNGK